MKTTTLFVLLSSILILISCTDEGDTVDITTPGITKAELEEVHSIIENQDNIKTQIDEMFKTGMDTLKVIDSIANILNNDPKIENAYASEFGVMVQYKNGLRGGIIINPLDEYGPEPPAWSMKKKSEKPQTEKPGKNIALMPLSKGIAFINPSYFERDTLANNIAYFMDNCSFMTGFNYPLFFKDNQCKLDLFTNLSQFGIVHIYSHGFPWPSLDNIQDVYVYTGEMVNDNSTNKYWDDIKKGHISAVKYRNDSTYYMINSAFIAKYNDFHENKTLWYGGYCFSWLGNWKNTIVDQLGASAYIGFDWAVNTGWNAWWASRMYEMLGDTSYAEPLVLDNWFNGVDQNYKSNKWNKWISVDYKGDGNLKLWGKTGLEIQASKTTALTGQEITFKAVTDGDLPKRVEYTWVFDDYSEDVVKINDNTAKHTYSETGNYTVTLQLLDADNHDLIGIVDLEIKITEDFEKSYKDLKYISIGLTIDLTETPYSSDDGTNFWNMDYDKVGYDAPLSWSGKHFSTEYSYKIWDTYCEDYINIVMSISGTLSEDLTTLTSLEASFNSNANCKGDYEEYKNVLSASNIPSITRFKDYFSFMMNGKELRNHIVNYYKYNKRVWDTGDVTEYKYETINWDIDYPTPEINIILQKESD